MAMFFAQAAVEKLKATDKRQVIRDAASFFSSNSGVFQRRPNLKTG